MPCRIRKWTKKGPSRLEPPGVGGGSSSARLEKKKNKTMTMAYVGRVATLLRKQLYMLHTKNENISVRKMNKIFSLKITMLNQVEYHL